MSLSALSNSDLLRKHEANEVFRIPIQSYQADWPTEPKGVSCVDRYKKIAWDVISVAIPIILIFRVLWFLTTQFIMFALLPQLLHVNHTKDNLLKIKNAFPDKEINRLSITSPDGKSKLDGLFFPGSTNPEKTIIYVLEREGSYETKAIDRVKFLEKTGASVIIMNPPGVEQSTGRATTGGWSLGPKKSENSAPGGSLAYGVYSTYEYLLHNKSVRHEDIVFYGRSFGGCYGNLGAALVQQKYPHIPLNIVNERSFSTLDQEIIELLGGKVGKFVAALFKFFGIHMDSANAFNEINRNFQSDKKRRKLVICHEDDGVIPFKASLFSALDIEESQNVKTLFMKENAGDKDKRASSQLKHWEHNRSFNEEEEAFILKEIREMLNMGSNRSEDDEFIQQHMGDDGLLDVDSLLGEVVNQ